MWDRAYGGSTLVIHVEGATIPGAPNLPEYLKADVYLPPHLIDERPECHFPIAAMVQTFIEEIGIPTVNRFIEAGRKFGWTFSQKQSTYAKPSSQNLALIPPPAKTGSAHYIFYGRPYGSLPLHSLPPQHSNSDQQHRPMPAPTSTWPSSPSESTDEYFFDEPDPIELALVNAAEKIADLESGLEKAALMEVDYIKEITNLRNELAEAYATLQRQESISHSLTQRIPSSSYHVSPLTTPQPSKGKQHAIPNILHRHTSVARLPQLTNLGYVSICEMPSRTKSKQEMESVMTVTGFNLGPATTEFITAHNLARFGPIVSLIITNHPPTKWSAMLGVLSLSDSVQDSLLDVLTADLEGGEARN
jgi:hypothetical protein